MGSVQHIASGRAALAAEVVGDGDPVVFLHANVCDSRMWRAQFDAVGARGKAIAYDRRGFGATRAGEEEFSSVADLMAVTDAAAGGAPAVLVGCSQGGRIALDAALLHPAKVRALVLIAPTVAGAPATVHPPGIDALLAAQSDAETSGDLDRLNAVKARLWLDGPLSPEGRVAGEARRLFLEMNAAALRSPPTGRDTDAAPAYHRLSEVSAPTLVVWGGLDFPHIQERSRHVAATVQRGSGRELTGAAHLPGLERPAEVTGLLVEFIDRCSGRRA